MSKRNRSDVWVIPQKEAEELLYGTINFKELIKDCLKSTLLKAPKVKLKYGRYDVKAELELEEKKKDEEEKKKGIFNKDLTRLFKK